MVYLPSASVVTKSTPSVTRTPGTPLLSRNTVPLTVSGIFSTSLADSVVSGRSAGGFCSSALAWATARQRTIAARFERRRLDEKSVILVRLPRLVS